MSEIKTAQERYEKLSNPVLPDVAFRDCLKSEAAELRAAYEALQKENESLAHRLNNTQDSAIKALEENAAQAKRIVELEFQLILANSHTIEEMAKRIAELENDIVEWNEFKKIRDMQMQALRKQMP